MKQETKIIIQINIGINKLILDTYFCISVLNLWTKCLTDHLSSLSVQKLEKMIHQIKNPKIAEKSNKKILTYLHRKQYPRFMLLYCHNNFQFLALNRLSETHVGLKLPCLIHKPYSLCIKLYYAIQAMFTLQKGSTNI